MYRSNEQDNEHRGGTVVCIRNSLCSQVSHIDTSREGQVWLQLKCVPGVLFGFCYIPPLDSADFKPELMSVIQEKNKSIWHAERLYCQRRHECRFGESFRESTTCVKGVNSDEYMYLIIPDPVSRPSDNV